MDSLRGTFGDIGTGPHDPAEDAALHEAPPAAIGQDERRMQVRAYNMWAAMLEDRRFPAIENLEPTALPDFAPFSVLLDFSTGLENPTIAYLGEALAQECGTARESIATLADVPSRSLLSRITDHYLQIIANQSPIGFEAEFVNQRGLTILYRGILLPYSSDDDTIDFIYGVINWKELAEQSTADELLLEIDQALEGRTAPAPRPSAPLGAWADGPVAQASDGLPAPAFGLIEETEAEAFHADWDDPIDTAGLPAATETLSLADCLASAREMAAAAHGSEDRTRAALYAAIGLAYDFALAAADAPADFAELVADAGLTMQERAPMTPLVKLVFGADYDKTRLTEYAAALTHAQRLALPRGAMAGFLRSYEGGLKGVVKAERAIRRDESAPVARREGPGKALVRRLRALPTQRFEDIAGDGSEFALVLIRRDGGQQVSVIGEVPDDAGLVQKAARKLVS